MADYPELEKLRKISDKSQAIGEFVDWLQEKGIFLASYPKPEYDDGGQMYTINTPITKLLAEFFGIDENKVEEERRKMLSEISKRRISDADG